MTKLLQDLRTRVDPSPTGLLGTRVLDDLVELFRYHETSPASVGGPLQAHNNHLRYNDDESEARWIDSEDNDASSRRLTARPPIVEITSPRSAAGKTSLLYLLTAFALLGKDYAGKASAVVWLDTVGHFSASRLARIMNNIISKHDSKTTTSTTTIVHQALTHLHIPSAKLVLSTPHHPPRTYPATSSLLLCTPPRLVLLAS